ncbi:hypothetical protein Tco_0019149 [Tanacetum coccineum]
MVRLPTWQCFRAGGNDSGGGGKGLSIVELKVYRARTRDYHNPGNLEHTTENNTKHKTKHGNGKCDLPHDTQTRILLHTTTDTDKHGVPPTKRLFKVAMLDPSPQFIGPWGTSGDLGQPRKWSTPAGLKLARENLQSIVKEEDSITDVENAKLFESWIMDSLVYSCKSKNIS